MGSFLVMQGTDLKNPSAAEGEEVSSLMWALTTAPCADLPLKTGSCSEILSLGFGLPWSHI